MPACSALRNSLHHSNVRCEVLTLSIVHILGGEWDTLRRLVICVSRDRQPVRVIAVHRSVRHVRISALEDPPTGYAHTGAGSGFATITWSR